MRRIALLAGSIMLTMAAHADYWVSIGSFKSETAAAHARDAAHERLTDPLSITPAETPSGLYFRVVSGPFTTRELAATGLSAARSAGFDDAWVITGTDSRPAAADTGGAWNPDVGLDADLDDDFDLDLDLDMDTLTDDLPPLEDLPSAEPAVNVQSYSEPVTEPPPGYQLNKLRRDQ